ncbi:MAG: ankyrin repeat-containing domain protein [Benjaminiella poitrasii]|nr:MAG: ankyrin repeat-containing domain protein [Benjaminiella poitrasii]
MSSSAIDFCTPAVPGEVHKYYGYSHNKYIKLPHIISSTPNANNTSKKKLLNTNSKLTKEKKTLRSVALSGNLSLLKQFLQMVSDPMKVVNEPYPSTGLTCLHFAASRGHLNIVQCLVEEYSINVDSTDKEGETALLKAAYHGHYHVIEYLLDHHANIHQKDKDGWTALHNACSKGYFRIVRLLVERKAKVDVKINAASKGYMSIVEYLLDEGHASPLIKNKFGETAYDVSAAAGESYICEMLEKSGRKWWHLQHTEGVLNPKNKRASMFGATYNILEYHVTVIVILHENQRCSSSLLSGLSRPQFSDTYLTKEETSTRGSWSLHPSGTPSSKELVMLPPSSMDTYQHRRISISASINQQLLSDWFWLTDWQIDYSDPRVDPTSGWQYSKSFEEDDSNWTPVAPTNGYNWVRRRRWHTSDAVLSIERNKSPKKSLHAEDVLLINNQEFLQQQINLLHNETLNHSNNPWTALTSASDLSVPASNSDVFFDQQQPKHQTEAIVLWESDVDAKSCRVCVKKFGLLLRRHHCRKCGLVFCDKCSSWKAFLSPFEIIQDPRGTMEPLAILASHPQRVCKKCYQQHQELGV